MNTNAKSGFISEMKNCSQTNGYRVTILNSCELITRYGKTYYQ